MTNGTIAAPFTAEVLASKRHQGMPPLDATAMDTSFFALWPKPLFYAAVVGYALLLSRRYGGFTIPTVANPAFTNGGVVGEAKSQILGQFSGEARLRLAQFQVVTRQGAALAQAEAILESLPEWGLSLPIVVKPDIGCNGVGVWLIENRADLETYLDRFPLGANLIVQRYVAEQGEAGVFFIRPPGAVRGHIFSLTLKYFPYVVGDGRQTLRMLIARDRRARKWSHLLKPRHGAHLDLVVPAGTAVRLAFAGNHAKGAIFRDGGALVTPAMTEAFDRIANGIPEFYTGRFDVRFGDIEALRRGEDFTIVELNGGTSEATHIWDSRITLLQAYATLFDQYRQVWQIGWANRKRGYKPITFRQLMDAVRTEKKLNALYPPAR